MFVKTEPTGICERKGLVQVKFCMYLEPGDYEYEKHYVQVYERSLTDAEALDPDLAERVGKVWQVNPFHNHFIYIEPDTPDPEITDIGQAFLEEAYIKWACDEKLDLKNPPVNFPMSVNTARLNAVGDKVKHLEATILERRVDGH